MQNQALKALNAGIQEGPNFVSKTTLENIYIWFENSNIIHFY